MQRVIRSRNFCSVRLIFYTLKLNYCKKVFFFLIHLFARDVLLLKKLEIEKTKTTFTISVLKVECLVVLVSFISNFFTIKTSLTNKWMSFSSSNLALKYFLSFFANFTATKDEKYFSSFESFGY